MTKQEFLEELRRNLAGLPQEDVEKSIEYYAEIVEDRIEDGVAEEEAVQALGSMEEITEQILAEVPLTKLVGRHLKPKAPLRGWEIAFLIIGFPLWFPLLITAAVLLLTAYVLLWVVVVVFYAVDFALAIGGVACLLGVFLFIATGNGITTIFSASVGCIAIGIAILLFYFCRVAKYLFVGTKKSILWIKRKMIKKEASV